MVSDFTCVWQAGPPLRAGDKLQLVEPLNRALAEAARATTSVELAGSVNRLQSYARRVIAFWTEVDVVVTPALSHAPVPVGWVFEPDDPHEQFDRGFAFTPFTPVVNVTGQPAAVVPFGWDTESLPLAVQLIAGPAREDILIRLSAQLEQARQWADRRPALAS